MNNFYSLILKKEFRLIKMLHQMQLELQHTEQLQKNLSVLEKYKYCNK